MLGHEIPQRAIRRVRQVAPPVLQAETISVPGKIEDLSICVSPGEIVGLGGLVGSGRTTLLRVLAGLEAEASGRLSIDGKNRLLPTSPSQALEFGIALIPEDRRQGLVLGLAAQENVVLADTSVPPQDRDSYLSRHCVIGRQSLYADMTLTDGVSPPQPRRSPAAINKSFCWRAGGIGALVSCWRTSRPAAST
jgi:ABC-type sugar transport system ATPase subunit